MPFTDRVDAGRRLAERLRRFAREGVVVLGLPRGGVPVAFEVARVLDAPLDVVMVRKLGVPVQPELAMGAVGEEGALVLNERVLRGARVTVPELAESERRARAEVERRAGRFRSGRSRVSLAGRIALLVDDGAATGATARVACRVVRAQGAARVVLAVPVASRSALRALEADVDELVCLEVPERFEAVGQSYADFGPTSDAEVEDLLRLAAGGQPPAAAADPADRGTAHRG
jgi:putative phosphoribosyl transferase